MLSFTLGREPETRRSLVTSETERTPGLRTWGQTSPAFSLGGCPAFCLPCACARGLLPNRNSIAVRYYENKKKYIVIIIGFVFLSSKPEVKNTLFEECDQRRRENLEMKKYGRRGTERNQTKRNQRYQKNRNRGKSFSSTKNSFLNHLLRDLKFKQ